MAQLREFGRLFIDIRKLAAYCLDSAHPRGRHKARVFREALGISQEHAMWLRDILLAAAQDGEAVELSADAYGRRWRIDLTVARHGRHAVIRSLWIRRPSENICRFVTCWVR